MAASDAPPRRRWLVVTVVLLVAAQVVLGVSGAVLFASASADPLRPVDAIVVLGGEHDGREAYGMELARSGLAPVVLLSNPYPPGDGLMQRLCGPRQGSVTVVCRRPEPATTRGEAMMAHRLAAERNWTSIIVVSWRYHLPRARLIFSQCFSARPGAVMIRDVPRPYRFSLVHWQYTFLYQYAAFAKAMWQGRCG